MANLLNNGRTNGKRNMDTPEMRRVVTAAFVNMPGALRSALKIDELDTVMENSTPTPDGEGFTIHLQGSVVCEIRPWDQKYILRDTSAPVVTECTINFADGFSPDDVWTTQGYFAAAVSADRTDYAGLMNNAMTPSASRA